MKLNFTIDRINNTFSYYVGDFKITHGYNTGPVEVMYIFGFNNDYIRARIIQYHWNKIFNPIETRYGVLTVYKDGTKHLKWD